VYRPENLHAVDQHHRQIINKTCVVSARDDNLQTIKIYLINAALKQGMSPETKVTGLADGANNCWSVLSIIKPECSTLECVLDWFHIGKRFQNVKTALGDALPTWTAPNRSFGGETKDALTKLTKLGDNVTDEATRSKIRVV